MFDKDQIIYNQTNKACVTIELCLLTFISLAKAGKYNYVCLRLTEVAKI
jgi:hypothetical protein